ncbi:MAG TPA: extracellular solute-binding protein [Candidatus Brocadiia bacterium]|nr:extracellular solute-binding protein [Candidatus Brocadiia bacterium]
MSRKTLLTLLFIALGATLALPFAMKPDTESTAGELKLTLISPHHEGIQKEFRQAFSRWHREQYGQSVAMEFVDPGGGTSVILKFIKARYQDLPNGIGIDVFFGGGTEPYIPLAEAGLLEPYPLPPAILNRIPQKLAAVEVYDPRFRWYGAAMSGFGIVFNKVVLGKLGLPEPKQWEDLANPAYFSWLGGPDPRQSGSGHMVYEIILQAHGWEEGMSVISRMSANFRSFSKSGSVAPKACAAGDIACGLAIDIYAWAQIDAVGEDKIGFCIPDGKSVINPDAIAILKGASNMELAQRFVTFVMSEPGQLLWILRKGEPGGPENETLNRLPVLPDLYETTAGRTSVKLNPFKSTGTLAYSAETGSARYRILNDYLGAAIIDVHPELCAAWQNVIKKGMPKEMVAELTRVPISEADFMALAAKWEETELRDRQINEWLNHFRDRYKRLAAQ